MRSDVLPDEEWDDRVLAEFAAPPETEPRDPQDVALAASWSGHSSAVRSTPPRASTVGGVKPTARELNRVIQAYLDLAALALSHVVRSVDSELAHGHLLPLSDVSLGPEQADALEALTELEQRGSVDVASAADRRRQIIDLGEAPIRLGALLGLYRSGDMTADELQVKRDRFAAALPPAKARASRSQARTTRATIS